MSDAFEKVLEFAMRLSVDDRRELARRLLDSLPSPDPAARRARWERLWAAEGCVQLGGDAVADTDALDDD